MSEFLAYRWDDPGPVIGMMLRLVRPPFQAIEVFNYWAEGATKFEWWMTSMGSHADHYHKFKIWNNDKLLVQRVQWGYSGNFEQVDDDTNRVFRTTSRRYWTETTPKTK